MADTSLGLMMHPDNRPQGKEPLARGDIKFPTISPKRATDSPMKACCFDGNMKISMQTLGKPLVTDPGDAIVRITGATVCGSDLHLYHKEFTEVHKNSIFGHEGVGIIESVGSEVVGFQPGDRVVVSCPVSCGQCEYCRRQQFSLCDCTNPSSTMEKLFGHRTGGILGYGGLLGDYAGTQAEYVRVPYADVNLLRLSPQLSDKQGMLLSDILCTAWHATELVNVTQGDNVAVWGLGPVGQLCVYLSKFRGAAKVVAIDCIPERLDMAKRHAGADDTINFQQAGGEGVVQELQRHFPHGGPEVCIDASAFRYASNILHKAERALRLETDTAEVVNQCITACKKGGRISLIADYYGYANHFALGPLMEKSILMRGGQVFCQKYWAMLQEHMVEGRINVDWIYTHSFPLEQLPEAYKLFDDKRDGVMKIHITTSAANATDSGVTLGQPAQGATVTTASGTGSSFGTY